MFQRDASIILDLKPAVEELCARFGKVKHVVVYDVSGFVGLVC